MDECEPGSRWQKRKRGEVKKGYKVIESKGEIRTIEKILPFICVIANNSARGQTKSGQKYYFKKRYIDTDLPDTHFTEIAEAFGCHGERVTDPHQIRPALERAKASNRPSIVDVITKFTTRGISKLGLSRM